MDPLALIVDAVPALIAYVDREERYGFANQAYEEWFGRPRSEMIGHTLCEFLGETRYAKIEPWVRKALAGERVTFEAAAIHRDGTPRIMRAEYVPDIDLLGVVRGYIGVVSDITDIRRSEIAKDEFLATLSHELRTPLNAVLGWVRLLREGAVPPEDHARAHEVIERNARVQIQLIEDLLDISRIVAGKAQLAVRPVHPVTLIDAVVDSMRPAAAANDIRIETSLDLRAGPIAADPARLQQVLWNLVANAIKFTGRGGRIDVRLARGETSVTIEVRDTGEGITRETLPHIFERFRQGESGTTRRHGGLGLGLALVKHLVEAHGGTVTADSPGPGGGTVFTVTLPLIAHAELHGARVAARPSAVMMVPADALQGAHALVVDDDLDAVDLFGQILRNAGAEVRTAVSTAAALAAVEATPPDVVLADLEMPGEDGFALIERLRAAGSRVPAVAVTAHGALDDRVRALAAGFDAHLTKPVSAEELVAVVRRLVSRADKG